MKKAKKDYFFNIFVLVIFISISLVLASKALQNDTFYTIKVGESISKYGVDMKEHFSWFSNLTYTYPHWLYDLLIYNIYNFFGFTGIYISNIVFGFILLSLMYFLTSNLTKNKYLSFVVSCLSFFTLGGYITARAQLISYMLLLLILYSIKKLRNQNNLRYYLYIFLCSLLIANIHLAVWPFIFVLYLPFLVSDIIYLLNKKYSFKFLKNYNITLEESSLKKIFISIFLTFLTGFMTPNFLVPFTYLYRQEIGESTSFIVEHLPINIRSSPIVFVFLLLFFLLVWNKKTKVKLSDLFLISGLFLMAFMGERNYSLLVILSVFSLTEVLNDFINFDMRLLFKNYTFTIPIMILFICLGFLVFCYNQNIDFYSKKEYPIDASNYVKSNLDSKNIRLFNEYDYGSYLIFRDIKVFIDSRSDLYLREFNKDCDVFDDYRVIKNNYDEIFKKYDITHVLVENKGNLNQILKVNNNYSNIYSDSYFTIYQVLTTSN